MQIVVEKMPVRVGPQMSETAYAIICDGQIRDWYKNVDEAKRMAHLLREDSKNPEDY